MSHEDQAALQSTLETVLDERLGRLFRQQGIKLGASFVTLLVAAVLAWASLTNQVSVMDHYGTSHEQKMDKVIYQIANKLGIPVDQR